MEIEQILGEYKHADGDKRMSMFLYYRELRDDFACIEQADHADSGCRRRVRLPTRKKQEACETR